MAYEVIKTLLIGEKIQEEVKEDGVLITPYARLWGELVISQERNTTTNTSSFKAELKVGCTIAPEIEETTVWMYTGSSYNRISGFDYYTKDNIAEKLKVPSGTTRTKVIRVYDSTDGDMFNGDLYGYHDLDGVLRRIFISPNSSDDKTTTDFTFKAEIDCYTDGGFDTTLHETKSTTITPLSIERGIVPTTADSFTDEENPTITYTAAGGKVCAKDKYNDWGAPTDTILSIEAAISLDGVTPDIEFREIPTSSGTYVFELTEQDRLLLRQRVQGSNTTPIYYLFKTVRAINSSYYTYDEKSFNTSIQRTLTIVGCNPTLNPTVKDIKQETLALTGDENTFIRYASMAEYAINAVASKEASIVTQYVQCGSKKIVDLPQGVIDNVESADFKFYILDSRNMAASSTVFKNLVEYVKPTCYQTAKIELSGETGAKVNVTINGSYYNGSFGAADNTLLVEMRYTDDNGDMGDWIVVNEAPTFDGTSYTVETSVSGFSYSKAYVFQCRVTDKIYTAQSSQYTIRLLPIFDWSEKDFNFNIPVNIDANELNMSQETILRYNDLSNRAILSGGGGGVYLRPNGTESTDGEMIIKPDGSVSFGGTVNLDNGFTIGGKTIADYIVETGEEAMGTNGTWYWAKWASGKAECWGCRNFGNTAVTTAWGNLYRSAVFSQSLPDGLFKTTPDVITMNVVNSNYGGWICKHENSAPSAVTTGSFIFTRPASATVSPLYIGFHVIGISK